jgi:hypothetical protein
MITKTVASSFTRKSLAFVAYNQGDQMRLRKMAQNFAKFSFAKINAETLPC